MVTTYRLCAYTYSFSSHRHFGFIRIPDGIYNTLHTTYIVLHFKWINPSAMLNEHSFPLAIEIELIRGLCGDVSGGRGSKLLSIPDRVWFAKPFVPDNKSLKEARNNNYYQRQTPTDCQQHEKGECNRSSECWVIGRRWVGKNRLESRRDLELLKCIRIRI